MLARINCCLWNARSLVNQITPFQSFVYSSALDLIALTETWLKSYIYNNELIPTNYAIYRNDRTSRGGGVMLAIKNNISSSLVHSPTHLELLTVTLNYTKVITICLLYIPPNPDPKYISDLTEYLNSLRHTENLIIPGDLNLPDVNWDSFLVCPLYHLPFVKNFST